MVEDRLRSMLRTDSAVRDRGGELETAVRQGQISASEAADEVLYTLGFHPRAPRD